MTTCEGTRTYQSITNNQVKFTCGEIKICQNFKNFPNIMTIPWLLQKKNFMVKRKRKGKIGMSMVIIESFYLIGYLDQVIRPLSYKTSGYVKTFKVKDGDKDIQNKLMSFRNKIEDLKI